MYIKEYKRARNNGWDQVEGIAGLLGWIGFLSTVMA